MGAYDYEKSKIENMGGKTVADYIFNSIDFVKEYSFAVTSTTTYTGNIINRPVFYYTKLREDILFINTRLISNLGIKDYIFAVNEKSFFKRFSIYDKNNKKICHYACQSVKELITKIFKNPNDYKIYLNLFKFEREGIVNCTGDYNNTNDNSLNGYLKDGVLVKFIGYKSFNKRLWLHYFNNPSIPYPQRLDFGEPGGTETYTGAFDITSTNNKKYSMFID